MIHVYGDNVLKAYTESYYEQQEAADYQVTYRTHVQSYGWEDTWQTDGIMSGTSGEAKRLEAIQIELYGEMAEKYDVYYCVHAQS